MKPKTAVFIIAIFGILVVVAAYVKRGEFGIGPEWALPVIAAAIVPLKEGGNARRKINKKRAKGSVDHRSTEQAGYSLEVSGVRLSVLQRDRFGD